MTFSIIIPTYNEESEIAGTLDAVVAIDYQDKEIIVVDDSSDRTPEIASRYADRGVRLIHPGGGGRCEARNMGITEARGEIVCLLNADVRPRRDFLVRLAQHYHNGADYVLVRSRVFNEQTVFARYLGSGEARAFQDPSWMEWTEGFSCRRALALKVGLFPVNHPVAICAGEDGFFGANLRIAGARKHIDLAIEVDNVVPDSLREFWRNRVGRGVGSTQIHRYIDQWSYRRIVAWSMFKTLVAVIGTSSLILPLVEGCRRAAWSSQGWRDWTGFPCVWAVERTAFQIGEWKGLLQIARRE